MRLGPVLLLLALPALADGPQVPREQRVRTGLVAPDRASREDAARIAREWAKNDPAGVAALLPDLDLRGRAALLRALAGAGTERCARFALRYAGDKEEAVFRAIVAGLAEGGAKAILAGVPEGVRLGEPRRRALAELRMRWQVEARFAALKSRSGRTGHYAGQYESLQPMREGAIEVMWHIVRNRSWPLPGDAGSEPYVPLHPKMLDYEPDEARVLAAYSFGELVRKDETLWQHRLLRLFDRYWNLDRDEYPVERLELAPALAFSLHDLGLTGPARTYIARLRIEARRWTIEGMSAMWDLGYAYMRIDKPEEGEKWYAKVIQLQDDFGRGVACYNLACHFAVRAAKEPRRAKYFREQSLRWLREAIEVHNFIDWVWMEEDGDLNAIREQPEYKRLRNLLKQRYPGRKRHRVAKDPEKFLKPK
ncbi:MAG: hypothetical protein ACYTHK_16180 [Planctomycetota bacterium]|jgi:hypothetical protein